MYEISMKKGKRMKVTLTDPKEIEIFDKLVDDMRVCHECGHIQPASEIPHDVYCLSAEQGLGYVEVECPKCGNIQVVLPMYGSFDSCHHEFDIKAKERGVDPTKDKIPSKLGSAAIDKLRVELKGKVMQVDEKKKKQARILL